VLLVAGGALGGNIQSVTQNNADAYPRIWWPGRLAKERRAADEPRIPQAIG
jgi:hypothetical protein